MGFLAGLAVLLAVACAVPACRSTPPTRYYLLAPAAPREQAPPLPASNPEGLRIGVEPFTVDPPYDHDRLIFRAGADAVEVGFYEYHRWAAPLSDLVAVAIAEGLRGTPGVAAVEPVSAAGDYSAYLRGRVIYLEELDLPGRQQARLRLELRLVAASGLTLWSQEVAGSAEGQRETVAEVVELLYRAFEEALEAARTGLAAAVATASD